MTNPTGKKRDPALVPLSHDHHHALVIAMLLRRASDKTAVGTRQAFTDFWEHDLREHFRVEERILFPVRAEQAGADDALLRRALQDHERIRELANAAIAADPPTGDQLVTLGDAISDHVRFEERELFPAIESGLSPERLAELGDALAREEGIDGPPGAWRAAIDGD